MLRRYVVIDRDTELPVFSSDDLGTALAACAARREEGEPVETFDARAGLPLPEYAQRALGIDPYAALEAESSLRRDAGADECHRCGALPHGECKPGTAPGDGPSGE